MTFRAYLLLQARRADAVGALAQRLALVDLNNARTVDEISRRLEELTTTQGERDAFALAADEWRHLS
ncbi:MAG TPA: hypothetical protein VNR17_10125 [Luteimicrobium sp.]|nr:hypothetical protein [Luteimicrobium sp.]